MAHALFGKPVPTFPGHAPYPFACLRSLRMVPSTLRQGGWSLKLRRRYFTRLASCASVKASPKPGICADGVPAGGSIPSRMMWIRLVGSGSDTTYRCEYGLSPDYTDQIPIPDEDIGSGTTVAEWGASLHTKEGSCHDFSVSCSAARS